MADNIAATPGSGATVRTYDNGTAESPAAIIEYITGGSAGAWTMQYVALATGLPVQPQTGSSWAVTFAQDVMLGTDFSGVFGTASLVTTTQADGLANTLDGVNGTCFGYVFNGTTWDRARGDATNGQLVDLGANNDVVASQSGNWSMRTQDGSGNNITSSAAGSTRPLDIIVRDTSGTRPVASGVRA